MNRFDSPGVPRLTDAEVAEIRLKNLQRVQSDLARGPFRDAPLRHMEENEEREYESLAAAMTLVYHALERGAFFGQEDQAAIRIVQVMEKQWTMAEQDGSWASSTAGRKTLAMLHILAEEASRPAVEQHEAVQTLISTHSNEQARRQPALAFFERGTWLRYLQGADELDEDLRARGEFILPCPKLERLPRKESSFVPESVWGTKIEDADVLIWDVSFGRRSPDEPPGKHAVSLLERVQTIRKHPPKLPFAKIYTVSEKMLEERRIHPSPRFKYVMDMLDTDGYTLGTADQLMSFYETYRATHAGRSGTVDARRFWPTAFSSLERNDLHMDRLEIHALGSRFKDSEDPVVAGDLGLHGETFIYDDYFSIGNSFGMSNAGILVLRIP